MSNNDVKISVTDEVQMSDIFGNGPIQKNDTKAHYYERVMPMLKRYVPPHNTKARTVVDADIPRVVEDGKIMLELCHIGRGIYNRGEALAHTQIEDKDPLRFFVTIGGEIVINPVITKHTKVTVDMREGCLSFPEELIKTTQRYNKVTVTFQMLKHPDGDTGALVLTEPYESTYNGKAAMLWQHECAHLNGHNIYDTEINPKDAIEYGDK